ncbi:DUF550 domain-containing protein [Salmonella enterica]|uniref:DUF550 domain-containing protein n=1 Tax=Salmonella enterica TaxID=28901 RepID=UPI00267A2194
MTTITNNKLTDEEITALALKLFDGSSFYFQSGRRPGAKTMAELLNKAASAVAELQERRRTDNQEPAPERERIRREHAEWSDATFSYVGPIGPLKHLSKEALEAAAVPDDLSEWADMQFLLWDAQRRAGIRDEQINQAMIEKLAINKARQWPEPKDGEPRLHIKEQPAPVVPESISVRQAISALESADCVTTIGQAYKMGWNACRAAMLQSKYRDLSQPVDPQISEYEKIMQRAGWVMVPVEPTDEMIEAAMNCEDVLFNSDESFCVQFGNIYEAMLAAAPQH